METIEEDVLAPSTLQTRRRRPKPQASCDLCHRRKRKCDRRQPCQTCAYRGLSHSCSYERQQIVEQPPRTQPNPDRVDKNEILELEAMRVRIAELEGLLLLLKNTYIGSSGASGGGTGQNSQWTAILHRVADLKTYLYTKGHVSPGAPNDRASGDEGPAHDIIKPLPASSEATNSQESNQTAPTTWKKHPLPWMQHFYVPATYDGRTDHATALGW